MKSCRYLLASFCASIALATPANALDKNGNGVSDVFEFFYYSVPLTGPQLLQDVDGDGRTTLSESIFGTDPWDPQSREPQVSVSAPNPDLGFSFASVPGIRYQVQGRPDWVLPWANIGTPLTGTGGTLQGAATGSFGSSYFLRLDANVMRQDGDGDTLDAYEENLFGSSDSASNSDTDQLSDLEEFRLNVLGVRLDPSKEFTAPGVRDGDGDADRDGVSDRDELLAGTNPSDNNSYPAGHPSLDLDSDDLPDAYEVANFGDTTSQSGIDDPDGDGITNRQERILATNPNVVMTDGIRKDGLRDQDADNVLDVWELQDGTDPRNAASVDFTTNFVVLIGRLEH